MNTRTRARLIAFLLINSLLNYRIIGARVAIAETFGACRVRGPYNVLIV